MNIQECDILNAIFTTTNPTQRSLADCSGHSLGIVNRSIKKLTSDGYLTTTMQPTDKAIALYKHSVPQNAIILAIPCSRCLEDVNTVIPFDIDEEVSVDADDNDEEQYFIESHYVDTDKMLYTEILLSMPPKVLCKEDCKGICTVCGHNLNDGECGCDRFVPDPRMSAINDIFEQFSKNS